MSNLKFGLGGDHAGYELKGKVLDYLQSRGFEVKDFGPYSDESVDYPDYVHPVAKSVESGENNFGILICGSGNGVAMTANKYQDVRAGLCWTPELASLTKQHNNANVLCIPARFIDEEVGLKIVEAFVDSEFEGGRHQRRVDKISC
jgi:ribose 5-phosphate isomerase B